MPRQDGEVKGTMSQTPPDNTSRARTGHVRAGRDLKADNIVTGVQVQGANAEAARELLALARQMETGSVAAVQDNIAKNVVTGLQYLGQGVRRPTWSSSNENWRPSVSNWPRP
jgi:hypothetical protein